MQEFSNDNNLTLLGIQIERIEGELALNQIVSIAKILERFCMSDCSPCSLPIEPGLSLGSPEPGKVCNVPYKDLLGSLMYTMKGTRPGISFSVLYFLEFQNSFDIFTWKHLKNILKGFCLMFLKGDSVKSKPCEFVDADFGNDKLYQKSVTGYMLSLFTNCIVWRPNKQNVVSLCSCEAYYFAVSECVSECIYAFQLIEEVVSEKRTPVTVIEDNQFLIKMTNTLETK
ncbi:hypothetical protein PR048_013812 [Dryococelus australis]|uniref:Uncharacterized protein n=1 Tax=Dryococelus australis TaxID=614101 RepID=A0ABQ9HT78_9NEOP|nr:hypothetical protein PR048_013812 [Dryococelus australis]